MLVLIKEANYFLEKEKSIFKDCLFNIYIIIILRKGAFIVEKL